MKKWIPLLTLAVVLAGCSGDTQNTNNPAPEAENQKASEKHIVTSFYPLAYMAGEIVGDAIKVTNLAGARDVHHYEPSPKDLTTIYGADLVIYQGAELELWTEGVIPEVEAKGVPTLAVSDHLVLHKMEEHDDHEDEHHDEDGHDEHEDHEDTHHDDHHEDDEHDDEDDHHEDDHHGHNHGEFDPHTWLDPVLAQDMVREILESVMDIDPNNSETYSANADSLIGRFQALHDDYTQTLTNCAADEIITSHDAYGYLAERYGFEIHTIAGLGTHDEPSAKILAELKEEAQEGISHILVEDNSIQRFANTLASETGLETAPINPLGRGTLDPSKNFFDIMNENLDSLAIALQCPQS